MAEFRKATKEGLFARVAFIGPSGSGKTYTALRVATAMCKKVAVIDSERGSSQKYADEFDFDVAVLDKFSPRDYIDAIESAVRAGYDGLVVDSLSHAWMGKGGVLEMHDEATMRDRNRNSYAAWRDVTPEHNKLVDALVSAPIHMFVTMRSKVEYVVDKDERGKTTVRKVGMQPVQRDGLEYEFDIVGDMDLTNTFIVSKTRCKALNKKAMREPGEDLAQIISDWLSGGREPRIDTRQRAELWKAAQAAGLDVAGLREVTNQVLGTEYSSPAEIGTFEAERVLEHLHRMRSEKPAAESKSQSAAS